jgi:hypothetical protein
MDYKIIRANPATAQIEVEFLLLDGYVVSIDLPIDENGAVPVGQELDTYIKGFLPYYLVGRNAKLSAGISNINDLMQHVEPSPPAVDANLSGLV